MENTTSSNQAGLSIGQPKMWKDLSVEEKLERTRETIKFLQSQVYRFQNQVGNLENDLKNHAHLDGKVVKDIKTIGNTLRGLVGTLTANPQNEKEGNVYF